jgi:hypothetical protein
MIHHKNSEKYFYFPSTAEVGLIIDIGMGICYTARG